MIDLPVGEVDKSRRIATRPILRAEYDALQPAIEEMVQRWFPRLSGLPVSFHGKYPELLGAPNAAAYGTPNWPGAMLAVAIWAAGSRWRGS